MATVTTINVVAGQPPASPAPASPVKAVVIPAGVQMNGGMMQIKQLNQADTALFYSKHVDRVKCCTCIPLWAKGAQIINITPRDAIFTHFHSYCLMPVSCGAGYDVLLAPLRQIMLWELETFKVCCCVKQEVGIETQHGGSASAKLQKGVDPEQFKLLLRGLMANNRNLTLVPEAKTFETGGCCKCLKNTTLAVGAAGDVTLTEQRNGCCSSSTEVTGGFVQDAQYVRYTHNNLLCRLCCGHKNRLELALHGYKGSDDFILELKLRRDVLPKAHKAIMDAIRGTDSARDPVIKTYTARKSEAVFTPGFVTVNVHPSCIKCKPAETTTLQAKQVAYLTAKLPSWQHALLKALRDIECALCCKTCRHMCCKDTLSMACCNPIPMAVSFWVLVCLIVQAILSTIGFCIVFCCRKTSVVFGGAGPAGQVAWAPQDRPEDLLGEISGYLETAASAQAMHTKAPTVNLSSIVIPSASPVTTITGAGKGDVSVTVVPVAATPGGSISIGNPMHHTHHTHHAQPTAPAAVMVPVQPPGVEMMGLAPPPLPPGWSASTSSNGATYYVSPSGETTWEHPSRAKAAGL